MDTKDFRATGPHRPHAQASRFLDRFMTRKGELVDLPLPIPAGRSDAGVRSEPREGSFVQLYLDALAAARQ